MSAADRFDREYLTSTLALMNVPAHLRDGLVEYIVDRRDVGHFLTVVLSNDLRGACEYADAESAAALVTIVSWLYTYAPSACWGSKDRVDRWLMG